MGERDAAAGARGVRLAVGRQTWCACLPREECCGSSGAECGPSVVLRRFLPRC